MIAQAAGINVHAGGLTLPVRHFLEKFGHFEPGDVVIHNDPYTGATHQGDGAIFRPMFYEKTLVGFSVNRGHWTDIGGMAPGGWAGTASHVVQEALRIPATKLYRAGVLATEIRDLIEHNIRFAGGAMSRHRSRPTLPRSGAFKRSSGVTDWMWC